MSFGYGKSGQNSKSRTNEPENVILINISKSIILYDLNDRENPIELSFQSVITKSFVALFIVC